MRRVRSGCMALVVAFLSMACGDDGPAAADPVAPVVRTAPVEPAPSEPLPTPPPPPDVEKPDPDADPVRGAAATRERWLRGPLRGHDNNMAAMRSVRIEARQGGYTVHVANQFGFRCGLELGDDGRPARMTRCRGEDGWNASPSVIELECEIRARDEVCAGDYMLGTDSYRSRARFQLIRRRDAEERP